MDAMVAVVIGAVCTAPAGRLAQVEVYAADEAALIHLRVTGPTEARLKHLTDPPRAYVDFPGLTWTGKSETIQTGGAGGLVRVRWSLFQAQPPVTRVVLDLTPGAQASVSEADEGLYVITTRPAKAGPVGAAPPGVGVAGKPLQRMHIVLDPAAGGDDPGVRGRVTAEKAVTLDIAVRAAVALMNAGALVTLTRDSDRTVPAQERLALTRALAPDIVVGIRCGVSANAKEQGIQTRYDSSGSAPLARELQSALVRKTGARNRGSTQSAEPGLVGLTMPGVTCVVGYLSSPEEEMRLASPDYRAKIAAGIVEGVAAYAAGNVTRQAGAK